MRGYNKTVLKNGLRIVSLKMLGVRSVSIDVGIGVGSRNELENENGISHFLEHMFFKGTKNRSAKEIFQMIESVGGYINASTGCENTNFYAKVLDEHMIIALDVLSDMLKNSLFKLADFKKEKSVIFEEIKRANDNPSDLVGDLFAKSLWKGSLGRPILGTSQSVSKIKRKQMLDYLYRNYTYPQIIVAAAGNVDHKKLVAEVEKRFRFSNNKLEDFQQDSISQVKKTIVKKKLKQTQICLGVPGFHFTHPQKYSLLLLNNILGGGMGSRLPQRIREDLGLAYEVSSFLDFFKDCGIFGAYAGTSHTEQVIKQILKEFELIKTKGITKKELTQSKCQLKGHVILGVESSLKMMSRIASHERYYNDYFDLNKSIALIDKVKTKDIIEVANQLLDFDKLCITVLGPENKKVLSNIK